jgi:hypothetical protein
VILAVSSTKFCPDRLVYTYRIWTKETHLDIFILLDLSLNGMDIGSARQFLLDLVLGCFFVTNKADNGIV